MSTQKELDKFVKSVKLEPKRLKVFKRCPRMFYYGEIELLKVRKVKK